MGAVFISYRREETAGEARALFNDLVARIGKDSVFMDVDNIALGRDFRRVLQENLASCELMLVLIGKEWVDAKNESGRRRLEDPGDFVRLEIGAALKRDIPVTPVLLQGAQMPTSEQLPEDLRDLSFRNGFELSHNRWDSDVQEMLKRLGLDKKRDTEASSRISALVTGREGKTLREKLTKALVSNRWALVAMMAVAGGVLLYNMSTTKAPPAESPVGRPERPTEAPPKSPGANDTIDRAQLIVEGTTVRGSKVTGQELYFFKFIASGNKTRLVLRKRSASGFDAQVDVYDHAENRVAGGGGGVALIRGPEDEPVTLSFDSAPGETYYVKVIVTQPAAEYELTVRED